MGTYDKHCAAKHSVAVVVPVFGREDALTSVPNLLAWHDDARVVVVDNGNASELSGKLRALASDRVDVVRLERNSGGSGGYIAGMKKALAMEPKCNFLWLLDDDAKPNANTLNGLLEAYGELVRQGRRVACVGSTLVHDDSPDVIAACGANYLRSVRPWPKPNMKGEKLPEHVDETVQVEYCAGFSCLIPRLALEKVGLWRDVFIHFDDVEWCLRAEHKFGLLNYATTRSTISHPVITSEGREWIRYFDARNHLWINSLYARKWFVLQYVAVMCLVLCNLLLWRMDGRRLALMLAFFDFTTGRRRTRDDVVRIFKKHGVE